MKYIYKVGFYLTCVILSNTAIASSCDSVCQLDQIKSYFSAMDKISLKDSSIKDVDSFLNLTHDNVKYIHVEYQASFNKETWRKAFIRNIKRGAYQNTAQNGKRIINSIFGKNHIAIEYSDAVVQEDGTWQQTAPLLVLFGFTEGKISLIKELW